MPLTASEIERARAHLGYPQATDAASLVMGVPRFRQFAFLFEAQVTRLLAQAEPRVRNLLQILDNLETRMVDAQVALQATSVGNLYIRPDHTDALEREYRRFAGRLSDALGVPFYPGSEKFKRAGGGGGSARNVTVA